MRKLLDAKLIRPLPLHTKIFLREYWVLRSIGQWLTRINPWFSSFSLSYPLFIASNEFAEIN